MMHALVDYVNLQTMKVGGLLKQHAITVLIDTGTTNNFMNIKRSNPKLIIRKGSNTGVTAYGSGAATLAADDGTQRYCLCEGGGSDD
ncbi:hypothetical protein BHE74_00058587 [Ensete ventricosum]|nr:hypothetical protein BHE74_00058587 [Ensete ventricosum]